MAGEDRWEEEIVDAKFPESADQEKENEEPVEERLAEEETPASFQDSGEAPDAMEAHSKEPFSAEEMPGAESPEEAMEEELLKSPDHTGALGSPSVPGGAPVSSKAEAAPRDMEAEEDTDSPRMGTGTLFRLILGILLFLAAFFLLYWNEGRAILHHKALKSETGKVISVSANSVDPVNNGKLIHVTGIASGQGALTDGPAQGIGERPIPVSPNRVDPANQGKLVQVSGRAESGAYIPDREFGISVKAIKLERRVLMYQWNEENVPGAAPAYEKIWSIQPIQSSRFQQPQGHANPGVFDYRSFRWISPRVSMGAFSLPYAVVKEIDRYEPFRVMGGMADPPHNIRGRLTFYNGGYYMGRDPRQPEIGDLRIEYRIVPNARVTVTAQQEGNSFVPYRIASGEEILRVAVGQRDSAESLPAALGVVSADNAIKLRREVQIYQWKEKTPSQTEKEGGGNRQAQGGNGEQYEAEQYEKVWSDRIIDSHRSKQNVRPLNREMMPVKSETFVADDVKLGDFALPRAMVEQMNEFEPLPVDLISVNLPTEIQGAAKLYSGGYFIGSDPRNPGIDDLRITYSVVRPMRVSVVARQQGKTFTPYRTETGEIEVFAAGTRTAEEMFASARSGNGLYLWLFRAGGFLLMFIGLYMILAPLASARDRLPVLGRIERTSAKSISLFLAAAFLLLTAATAWISFLPLIGGILLSAAFILAGVALLMRAPGAVRAA